MDELNVAKPKVEIELGGQVRHLLFDYYALSLVDEECGLEFLRNGDGDSLSSKKVVILTWAGLTDEMPSLEGRSERERKRNIRTVAEWIFSEKKLDEITFKVGTALRYAFGDKDEETTEKKELAGPPADQSSPG